MYLLTIFLPLNYQLVDDCDSSNIQFLKIDESKTRGLLQLTAINYQLFCLHLATAQSWIYLPGSLGNNGMAEICEQYLIEDKFLETASLSLRGHGGPNIFSLNSFTPSAFVRLLRTSADCSL